MEKPQFVHSQERQDNSPPSIWITQIRGSPSKWVLIQVLILVRARKVQLGILFVVMGPSGAGKTSFLDVISQRVLSSDPGASVCSFWPSSVAGFFRDDIL
jgi:ABC-type transport system involved in cytochrome bd biosynthesis fused ATPase/permease subunit